MSSENSHKRILWITRTGILIALLVVLQYVTSGTQAFAGQYITGSCVNAVLATAVLVAGLWSGVAVAIVSPFCARLLGIGPQVTAIVPAIAVGNLVFVLVLHFLVGRKAGAIWQKVLGLVIAAAAKFLTLFILVVKVIVPMLSDALKPQQITTFSVMFSYPQMITALIGGTLALAICPILKKALRQK